MALLIVGAGDLIALAGREHDGFAAGQDRVLHREDHRSHALGDDRPAARAGKAGIQHDDDFFGRQLAELVVEPLQGVAGGVHEGRVAVIRDQVGVAGLGIRRAVAGKINKDRSIFLDPVRQPMLDVFLHVTFGRPLIQEDCHVFVLIAHDFGQIVPGRLRIPRRKVRLGKILPVLLDADHDGIGMRLGFHAPRRRRIHVARGHAHGGRKHRRSRPGFRRGGHSRFGSQLPRLGLFEQSDNLWVSPILLPLPHHLERTRHILDPVVEQQFCNLSLAEVAGEGQRRPVGKATFRPFGIYVCPAVQQKLDHATLPMSCRTHECRHIRKASPGVTVAMRFQIRTFFEQHLCDFQLAFPRPADKRIGEMLLVRASPLSQQSLDLLKSPLLRRLLQGRGAAGRHPYRDNDPHR